MYTVEIIKKEMTKGVTRREWVRIKDGGGDDCYGYAPQVEEVGEVESVVLKQNVEEIDLKAVIKAINGI